jgi:hypothetical protein
MLIGVVAPEQRIRPLAAQTQNAEFGVPVRFPLPHLGSRPGIPKIPPKEFEWIIQFVDACDLETAILDRKQSEFLGCEMIETHDEMKSTPFKDSDHT